MKEFIEIVGFMMGAASVAIMLGLAIVTALEAYDDRRNAAGSARKDGK